MLHAKAQELSLSPSGSCFDSVEDALGVLRDAIASFSNVDTLLRSPKVGGRALGLVLPGLHEQRPGVTRALAFIASHLAAFEETRSASEELIGFIAEGRQRFGRALDRATLGLHTARERLAFEAEASRTLTEFQGAGVLLSLLLASQDLRRVDLDLREAIEQAFFGSHRSVKLGSPALSVVVSLPDEPCTLQACPAILMPLITLALSLVHRATGAKPSLVANKVEGGSLVLVISDRPAEGDWLTLRPSEIIPPTLACAETAARLSGVTMRIGEGEREIELRMPRN